MSEQTTCVSVSSCSPTPTASAYGSSNNGCPGDGRETYATAARPSPWSKARSLGGVLNPAYPLWQMGFPEGHVALTGEPWATPLFRRLRR
jgi:hypothetical protein